MFFLAVVCGDGGVEGDTIFCIMEETRRKDLYNLTRSFRVDEREGEG